MKKNIIIILLLLISAFFFVYSFIKADEAQKQQIHAEFKEKEAQELRNELEKAQAIAEAAAQEARAQAIRAEQALADCQANQ